jgi:hypothetical protein
VNGAVPKGRFRNEGNDARTVVKTPYTVDKSEFEEEMHEFLDSPL